MKKNRAQRKQIKKYLVKQAGTITSNTNNHNEIKTVKRKDSKNIRMKGTVCGKAQSTQFLCLTKANIENKAIIQTDCSVGVSTGV